MLKYALFTSVTYVANLTENLLICLYQISYRNPLSYFLQYSCNIPFISSSLLSFISIFFPPSPLR
jgi:hypothetical protein